MLKSILVIVGGLLSFFAIIELIRVYQTLHALHPITGFVFIVILGLAIIWIIGYYLITLTSRPAVLRPPKIAVLSYPTNRELHRYGKYLVKYISRFTNNDAFTVAERDLARTGNDKLMAALKNNDNHESLLSAIEKAEQETIQPLLNKLDQQAERQVRNSTRDVMIAVAFSPYNAIDLLVVIYRNINMVTKIVRIYNVRPRLRQQLHILADTISVVATVNYLNLGSHLLQDLGSRVPIIGKSLDNIVQGIGAGLMTSVAGHAALYRCQAFKKWSADEARINVISHLHQFYSDVKGIFFKDVLPGVKNRLGEIATNKWKSIQDGIAAVLDETGDALDRFVRQPMATTGSSVMSASKTSRRTILKAVLNAGAFTGRSVKRAGTNVFVKSKSAGIKVVRYSKAKLQRKKSVDE